MVHGIDNMMHLCSEGEPGHPEHGFQFPYTRDQKTPHGAISSL